MTYSVWASQLLRSVKWGEGVWWAFIKLFYVQYLYSVIGMTMIVFFLFGYWIVSSALMATHGAFSVRTCPVEHNYAVLENSTAKFLKVGTFCSNSAVYLLLLPVGKSFLSFYRSFKLIPFLQVHYSAKFAGCSLHWVCDYLNFWDMAGNSKSLAYVSKHLLFPFWNDWIREHDFVVGPSKI